MSDVLPRVILDELVALAVHHLGDSSAARELVDEVLAEHPDLAAAAVEAPSPAERLQAVDRLFGRVRWAVRERLPGVGRSAPAPPATRAPLPTAEPAASPAEAPPSEPAPPPAPAPATAAPPPAPVRPATPPWAPARPAPPESPAPRTPVVPPAATIPQLEPPRTFIPPVVSGAEAEPDAHAAEPPAQTPPGADAVLPDVPEVEEPAAPERSPAASAGAEPARPAAVPPAAIESVAAQPSAVPQLKLRPPPPMAPAPAHPEPADPEPDEPAPEDGAASSPVQAIRPPRAAADREPPPLQVEIVDDLYGIEAAAQRRRRILAGLAGLAGVAGVAWLVVLADLPQYFQGWAWPGSSPDTTTAEAPAEPEDMPPLESLELQSPEIAADQPDGAADNGTQLILRLDQTPEPAAGPDEAAARVFIHYDADAASSSAAASALYARLAEAAAYATVVLRDVPYAIGRHRVRYYYAADRPAAEALVERLGEADWQLQDFTNYRPLPVRGTLEVFVPTN